MRRLVDDGELLWTAPIELEQRLDGMVAGMRAKDEGVVVAVLGLGAKWSTVVAVGVSAAGEQSIRGRAGRGWPRLARGMERRRRMGHQRPAAPIPARG